MKVEQYTYWSMTINNPDENDWILVRNPNEKYIRQLIHTREVGEEGTEHIQAWVRLQRNNSMSFMKKLYPRAHLRFINRDEYNENTQVYAQKNDDTTGGAHINTINDPLPANDTLLYRVLEKGFDMLMDRDSKLKDHYDHEGINDVLNRIRLSSLYCDVVEREMIMERSGLEKIFVSPAYEKMKVKYWKEIIFRLKHKQEDGTNEGGQDNETCSGKEEDDDSEDYEEGSSETDEGHSEGASSSSYEEDDSRSSGKQRGWMAYR